ncbi:NmrA family NAD(P)-binding protein [Anaeromyxobacter diazotrophicus]|uniref:Nucleotide-diphosphate-sugar epimerase n=1 Tax=Anaeromyxobacter diazotrophicus TaxID=2590199 RepID=A0A7I9VIK6_9BACT|nr:NmrA family NAD(P)-binding protein [Anaeromyxobacter diazotrophicus]GEJ55968.1 nucleotide-diphosphate-sugar epimerase [Anaeromyxobacter diazotrophicus]
MRKPRIVVTGATGKTGAIVVAELLRAGYPVRAVVHGEDARSARLQAQGAEIAVADMSDVERIADALQDVQRAYYCPPFDPYMIQGAAAFAVAARDARLEHLVGLTQWLASPSHPSLMTRQHWLVDRLFAMVPGITHTIVNPGIFADAYLEMTGVAAQLGIFPWIGGSSRNAPASNEDIARVAVAALTDPARHAGRRYRPTGPRLLGAEDMAQAIGRAVGRAVRVAPTPPWMFLKAARMNGLPIDLVSGLRYYIGDHGAGAFELGAPTTDVLEVTGRPAEDFETIARRYAALPQNRRTFRNWVRQVAQFLVTPLVPGFDLDRYDRELRRPFPSEPQLARDSEVWRREHVAVADGVPAGASREELHPAARLAAET